MATRTVQLLGAAFSETGDVSIAVTMDTGAGPVEVFNGVVPTTAGVMPEQTTASDKVVLASYEMDDLIQFTSLPVTITPSNGDISVMTFAWNNYNPLNLTEFVPSTVQGQKSNPSIDGVPFVHGALTVTEIGSLHYNVTDASVFACDMLVGGLHPDIVGSKTINQSAIVTGTSYVIAQAGNADWAALGAVDPTGVWDNITFTATANGDATKGGYAIPTASL